MLIEKLVYSKELHNEIKEDIDFNAENNVFDPETDRVRVLLEEIERLDALLQWKPISQKPDVIKNTLLICVFDSPLGRYVDRATYFPGTGKFSSDSVIYWMPMPGLPGKRR